MEEKQTDGYEQVGRSQVMFFPGRQGRLFYDTALVMPAIRFLRLIHQDARVILVVLILFGRIRC